MRIVGSATSMKDSGLRGLIGVVDCWPRMVVWVSCLIGSLLGFSGSIALSSTGKRGLTALLTADSPAASPLAAPKAIQPEPVAPEPVPSPASASGSRHRAGFVSILGVPNVGKSTLLNKLVGEKLSITTSKAQTTRHRIMGILNGDDYQIVYSDTPGVLLPHYKLQEGMMRFVRSSIIDADVLLLVVDVFQAHLRRPLAEMIAPKVAEANMLLALAGELS